MSNMLNDFEELGESFIYWHKYARSYLIIFPTRSFGSTFCEYCDLHDRIA